MSRVAVIPVPLATCCTVLSCFGVAILLVLGAAFDANVEVLMGHSEDPKDGHAVAQTCYSAAIVYAVFIALCGCQAFTGVRYKKPAVRL
ncbi:uncharacterized protein L969DRAFT_16287 [Mixia osmundae IAM 14324]|uniref:MARVEL domain-containing protein n=1 Tax=Mixia osmundae (strain CBS 9802 / IAM 14324 / JCM 22182 / KY 12970) TaxID=764103 RepID=G7DWC5_MIXOS|nr:uncharacterized protein L969DRAFT_16287 [Mixia osmundae IAM 14324]KEI40935.1 hypothetical protein L969DRAFT_16287 [Mixia osmundae IAM 14324]GAA94885.1 hypothetical protein E5Q_01540 [Mixia osmundae IAM 14324]